MKRLVMASLVCLVFSTSTGCCWLDRLFMCHGCGGGCGSCYDDCGGCGSCGGCGGYSYGGGWGCESYPNALCASDRACCEPCGCHGDYTGPPHDYHPGSYGPSNYHPSNYGPQHYGAPADAVWTDGPARKGEPTPAEHIPPGKQSRRPNSGTYR